MAKDPMATSGPFPVATDTNLPDRSVELSSACEASSDVTIDLSEMRFMDSSALRHPDQGEASA